MKKEIREEKIKKIILVVLMIILMIVVGNIIISGGGDKKGSGSIITQQETLKKTPAYMLAVLDVGHQNPSQEMIKRFDNKLDSLLLKCQENNKLIIGDYIVKSQEMLKKEGEILTLYQIIDDIDKSIPDDSVNLVKCSEIAALFVTLIISQ